MHYEDFGVGIAENMLSSCTLSLKAEMCGGAYIIILFSAAFCG